VDESVHVYFILHVGGKCEGLSSLAAHYQEACDSMDESDCVFVSVYMGWKHANCTTPTPHDCEAAEKMDESGFVLRVAHMGAQYKRDEKNACNIIKTFDQVGQQGAEQGLWHMVAQHSWCKETAQRSSQSHEQMDARKHREKLVHVGFSHTRIKAHALCWEQVLPEVAEQHIDACCKHVDIPCQGAEAGQQCRYKVLSKMDESFCVWGVEYLGGKRERNRANPGGFRGNYSALDEPWNVGFVFVVALQRTAVVSSETYHGYSTTEVESAYSHACVCTVGRKRA
jgi:hypothetical protein